MKDFIAKSRKDGSVYLMNQVEMNGNTIFVIPAIRKAYDNLAQVDKEWMLASTVGNGQSSKEWYVDKAKSIFEENDVKEFFRAADNFMSTMNDDEYAHSKESLYLQAMEIASNFDWKHTSEVISIYNSSKSKSKDDGGILWVGRNCETDKDRIVDILKQDFLDKVKSISELFVKPEYSDSDNYFIESGRMRLEFFKVDENDWRLKLSYVLEDWDCSM